ncbi:MAG: STAS domain-containing protein, partial [Verrucomicrobia bacterium]|nr:STAS domain-containing protein [Verrucomicrobiota bacterium]
MRIDYIENKNRLTCRFSGQLTTTLSTGYGETLVSQLEALPEQGRTSGTLQIVFDMEHVTYLSSSFLRVCVMAAKRV